jgi:hypothetical protein
VLQLLRTLLLSLVSLPLLDVDIDVRQEEEEESTRKKKMKMNYLFHVLLNTFETVQSQRFEIVRQLSPRLLLRRRLPQ